MRRVKCDETAPNCMRCSRSGRTCDGYDRNINPPARRPARKPLPLRRILLPIVRGPEPSLSNVPISMSFQDDLEARYFRFFYQETADALDGGFDGPLFKTIVLKACHDQPCILHGTVAIAALDRACKERSSSPSKSSEDHHRYALCQYSKALKGVREAISEGMDSLRTTLIASLLIYCFENFHGDTRLALTNVQGAVKLMHAFLESYGGPRGGLSPAPDVVEDCLVQAFARLDVHLQSWIDFPQPSRWWQRNPLSFSRLSLRVSLDEISFLLQVCQGVVVSFLEASIKERSLGLSSEFPKRSSMSSY